MTELSIAWLVPAAFMAGTVIVAYLLGKEVGTTKERQAQARRNANANREARNG